MIRDRRSFLRATGTAAATLLLPPGPRRSAPRARPNILFVLTDDQRFDAFGAGGCRELSTPVMDRLAAEGLSFSQATIMGGNSGAVCVPSRSMILTGASLFRCEGAIPQGWVTMPQLLRENGYATFVTGKWHNDAASLLRSFEHGEAVFEGGMSDHFEMSVRDVRQGQLINKRTQTTFDAEVFADATIGFLKGRPKGRAFFAYLSFKTPHDPRVVPARFHRLYDARALPLPPNFLPEHPFDNGEMKIRDETLAGSPRTPDEIRAHIAAYYAAISATDDQIGRVLKVLDDLNLTADTIVVFTSDNGLAVGQHGLMGKQNLYEHSCRVPLILRGPGIPRGRRSEALCQLFDLFPTLAGFAGLSSPATSDGKDLGPVLRGEAAEVRDATLHAYRGIQRAVRTRDAKLIEYLVDGKRTTQLFDLRGDPWETANLAGEPAHADRVKTLRVRLDQLLAEFGAAPLGQEAG